MKKRLLAIGLVVVLAVGGYYLWNTRRARLTARQQTQAYATAIVKRDAIEVSITGTANIVPVDKRTIKSTVAGRVEKILVADGEPVKEGQVIAVLSNDDLWSQYEQARIDLESQKLKLESYRSPTAGDRASAESRVQQAQTAVDNRRKDLEKLTVSSPINGRVVSVKVNPGDSAAQGQVLLTVADDTSVLALVQVPQSEISKIAVGQPASLAFGSELPPTDGVVDGIGAEGISTGKTVVVPVAIKFANTGRVYRTGLAVNASIRVKSDETVYAAGTVAPQVKYEIRTEVSGTVDGVFVKDGDEVKKGQVLVKLVNDSLQSALALAESELQTAKENLDRVRRGLTPTISENEVKQQELRVRQAELTLQKRAADVDALSIKSPISGTLVSHSVNVGDTVTANANLFVVADYSKMQMVIPVDELDITQVKLGQKATITVEALPGRTFTGEVTKIATEGVVKDGIANYDVTITLTDTKDLRGSMTGNATILVARKDGVLVVPAEAVRTQGVRKRVLVLNNGVPTMEDVQTGLTNGVITEILSGLKEGDTVVISSERQGPRVMTPFGPAGGAPRVPSQPSQPARPGGR